MQQNTHSTLIGYLLWIFGFLGSHRFYYGKPITGTIWFFTLGLFFVGWIIDLFLIPSMDREADMRFQPGPIDYTVGWILLTFLGVFGGYTACIRVSGSQESFTCSPVACSLSVCFTTSGR